VGPVMEVMEKTQSRVREAMSTYLQSLPEDHSLPDALELMEQYGISAIPVIAADGTPRGLLHKADIPKTVGDACAEWASIDADASIDDALAELEWRGLGRLPVEEDGKVVGAICRAEIREYQAYEWEVEREYGVKLSQINREVSPNDTMFNGYLWSYMTHGLSALSAIRRALDAAEVDVPRSLLDFGCGHGRTLRYLQNAFPRSTLTVTDVSEDAVDFCGRVFGVEAVQSDPEPRNIDLPGTFDLIWCASVVTHVDQGRWPGFLQFFESHLSPGGVLVFTIGGEHVANILRDGGVGYGIDAAGREHVLAEYDRHGFGYVDYPNWPDYGVSVSSPEWAVARVESATSLEVVDLSLRGLDDHQDVITCRRTRA